VVKSIAGLGFRVIHIEPVVSNGVRDLALDSVSLAKLRLELPETAECIANFLRKGVKVFPFVEHLQSFQSKQTRTFRCGAGTTAFSYDVHGHLYPCHRFHGRPEFRIEKPTMDPAVVPVLAFQILQVSKPEPCSRCWAAAMCWGCCPGESVAFGQALGQPDAAWCRFRRLESELSLLTAVASQPEPLQGPSY
jgi:radical SAM protein with 4Fe4S-binding SPASM domain